MCKETKESSLGYTKWYADSGKRAVRRAQPPMNDGSRDQRCPERKIVRGGGEQEKGELCSYLPFNATTQMKMRKQASIL